MKTLIQTTLKQPTWRWDYVTSLVNSNIFPKCSDDVYIKSAFGFANKYKKICNSTQIIDAENQAPLPAATVKRLTALYAQYPYVSTAFDMHEGGKFSAKSLEAMVLAKVPQEHLVAAYGLPLETIKTYEHSSSTSGNDWTVPHWLCWMVYWESH